jgi:hypothetical protein
MSRAFPLVVIPAQAGTHRGTHSDASGGAQKWVPACAGMTVVMGSAARG